MKKFLTSFAAVFILLTSCKKHDLKPEGTFKGSEVNVFNGKAYTLFKTDNWARPKQLAVVITDDAINSLPMSGKSLKDEYPFLLAFHPRAVETAFDHAELDWNPNGHPPPGIYTVPHFDFHFYTMSVEEQMAIPPFDVDPSKFLKYPGQDYLPPNYISTPPGVPMMGMHWVDVTSAELHGEPFTQTFIYGTYDGKVTFYEPMVALDYLKSTNNFTRQIPLPAKVQKPGFYPTSMHILRKNGTTQIILENFVFKQKS